ncbi:hypothetical protein [Thioalkalivibrio sulfidiphilus]|uniref:hypothetical protein n=1 Tax=Thioalkalivibrio sulfidiphilus TaxID=1033854 RepID=UPI00037F62BB|nr:hypothetical protein [Thioalkalivibrio sulfidiphilus]
MRSLKEYPVNELKLIYQTLHASLPNEPELMDSLLLEDLQRFLQERASQDGVDVSTHSQWAGWLNDR